jgi:hypothetical protein
MEPHRLLYIFGLLLNYTVGGSRITRQSLLHLQTLEHHVLLVSEGATTFYYILYYVKKQQHIHIHHESLMPSLLTESIDHWL